MCVCARSDPLDPLGESRDQRVTRSVAEPRRASLLITSVIMGSADDVQRLFLQALMSRRVVTKALARILLKKCVEAVKGPSSHPIHGGRDLIESRSRKRGLGYPDPGYRRLAQHVRDKSQRVFG